MGRLLDLRRLGRVEYVDGLALQERFGAALGQALARDTLLLLEHPPVFTLGRAAKKANVKLSEAALRSRGFQLFETSRGGDVTYHGPGQLVGYPIVQLEGERRDVRRYVRGLEEVLIRTAADLGVEAFRDARWPGVWTGSATDGGLAKLAALGVHISRWRTSHGFALNIQPDLSHFDAIVPCGIEDAGVTSLAELLGRPVAREEVEPLLVRHFAEVFEYEAVVPGDPPGETVAVAVVDRSGREEVEPRVLCLRRTAERGGFWQLVTGRVKEGEAPAEAAAREVAEEVGRALPAIDLRYRHAFALGDALPPPLIVESGFRADWEGVGAPTLDPSEHDAFDWLSVSSAIERMPFEGLRETIRRATSIGSDRE